MNFRQNLKKIIIRILLSGLLFFSNISIVVAYQSPGQPIGFVNDYARLFSAEQISVLENQLIEYEKNTTNEISVVTITRLEGDTIESYATTLFNEWGIGKADKNNGVLILIALEDRLMRIEVGDGLTSVLTNTNAQEIIDTILRPAFRSNDYYGGVTLAVNRIEDMIAGIYISPETTPTMQVSFSDPDFKKGVQLIGLSFFIIFLSIALRVYGEQRLKKPKRSIVPQYDPPQNLRPAFGEFIMKTKFSSRAWAATLVDLAVRGYISISDSKKVEETKKTGKKTNKVLTNIIRIIFLGVALMIGFQVFSGIIGGLILIFSFFSSKATSGISWLILILCFSPLLFPKCRQAIKNLIPKTYAVTKRKEFLDDPALENFEKEFLGILFEHGDIFLTSGKSVDGIEKYSYFKKFQGLRSRLIQEIMANTGAFTKIPKERKNYLPWFIGFLPFLAVVPLLGGIFLNIIFPINIGYVFLLSALIYALVVFLTRIKKLDWSDKGELLRDDLYGFKMYLETAERYRLQNLTPELFQKFLPYAMIFGVEDSWNKAFGKIEHLEWYEGDMTHFSSGMFSQSLSRSFMAHASASSGASFSGHSGGFGGGHSSGGGASGSW